MNCPECVSHHPQEHTFSHVIITCPLITYTTAKCKGESRLKPGVFDPCTDCSIDWEKFRI